MSRSIAEPAVIPARAGEFGDDDEALVRIARYVSLEIGGREVRLTPPNARKLAASLIAAADEMEGPSC